MWKTSLIIQPADEGDGVLDSSINGETTAHRIRKAFRINEYEELIRRTSASLCLQADKSLPTLQTASEASTRAFIDELMHCHERCDGRVPALCYAPAEELRVAGHHFLWWDSHKYDVSWDGDQVKYSSDPYARRYLFFGKPSIKVAADLIEPHIAAHPSGAAQRGLVFLNPVKLALDDDHAPLTSNPYSGCWFLPPWRDETHPQRVSSYFSAERLKIRAAMRQVGSFGEHSADEPAAITIQRLVDDPALRDLFLDGGQLRFYVRDDGAMDVSLEVFASNALSRFRASVAHGVAASWDWVGPLIESIGADVRSIVPSNLVGTAEVPLDWKIESDEASISRTESQPSLAAIWSEKEGAWQKIERTFMDLEAHDQHSSRTFFDSVLRPSASRGEWIHDLALKLYCSNFWRCPTLASQALRTAWELSAHDLMGVKSFQYRMLLTEWEKVYHLQCERLQDHYFVTYSGHATEELLWRWRLLFPLGTRISPRTLCLNSGERSRLDAGYVLA